MVYVPIADINNAKMINMQENIGYSIVDIPADPKGSEVIVIMDCLVMPKFGCSTEDVLKRIKEILLSHKPKICGVCFMNIFERMEWIKIIPYDILIQLWKQLLKRIYETEVGSFY